MVQKDDAIMINNSGSYVVDRGFVSMDLSMFELFGCFITLGRSINS